MGELVLREYSRATRSRWRCFSGSTAAIRWTELRSLARLDLDDHQSVAFAGDDIRLGISGREPVVAGDDRITPLAKVAMH